MLPSPLRLLLCPRDEGPHIRASRQDDGGDHTPHLAQVEAPLHLRRRDELGREEPRDSSRERHRQARDLHCLSLTRRLIGGLEQYVKCWNVIDGWKLGILAVE
jgi:hypothetical protein